MRFAIVSLVSWLLFATLPAAAADPEPAGDEPAAEAEGTDEVTREELERKKREVREMERQLREQERAREAQRFEEELRARREAGRDDDYDDRRGRDRRGRRDAGDLRMWFGVGTGIAYGWIETVCGPSGFSAECSEQGLLNTYMGNFTVSAPNGMALRLRGVRATDRGEDQHVPYETAVMVGSRFGRSNWYGLFGAGVLNNVDDDFINGSESTTGLAWEVIFAPSTYGPMGLELGVQGNSGNHADFIAFNFGVRFGALR
ncbi:MAG: hypothetical protein ACT4PK_00900 [Gammaproteobacteria bacterium]